LGYDFDIEYRNTTKFGQADCLSHLICNWKYADKETNIPNLTVEDDTQLLLFYAAQKLSIIVSDIKNATAKDLVLKKTMKYICIR
ncbi:unnamed protein product, partial [Hymenolepis diminuta]